MTSSKRLALVFALTLFASSAHAQRTPQDIETARQLYNQGIELRDKGDLKGALDKFRAAHALGNTPITGIELCRAYAALHQPVEAREVCLGVARIPPTGQETSRSQDARTEAGKIAEQERPKIGELRLKVNGIPAGKEALILIDGAAIPQAALGEPRAVNPGTHFITGKIGGGPETKANVETKEGETKDFAITVRAPADEAKAVIPASSDQPKPEKKSFPYPEFIVAGVGIAVGSVAGIVAIAQKSDLDDKCVNKQCGRELHGDLDIAEHWGNVSTAGFIVGGIGLAAGLIALALTPSQPQKVHVMPHLTTRGLGGSF